MMSVSRRELVDMLAALEDHDDDCPGCRATPKVVIDSDDGDDRATWWTATCHRADCASIAEAPAEDAIRVQEVLAS